MLGALDIPTTPIELPGVYDGEWKGSGDVFQSVCPATGEVLAHVKSVSWAVMCSALLLSLMLVVGRVPRVLLLLQCNFDNPDTPHWQASPAELHGALERTRDAYVYFRSIPAPKRGEIIRQIREALAAKVRALYVTMGCCRSLTPPAAR